MSQSSYAATIWTLTTCIDCCKPLRAPADAIPEKPVCLHCDIVRAAPEDMRDLIRQTLQPLPTEPT